MGEPSERDSRTEDPTEKKLQEAKQKGNTPVSREVGLFANMLALVMVCSFILYDRAHVLTRSLSQLLENSGGFHLARQEDATMLFIEVMICMSAFMLPIIAPIMVLGIAFAGVQHPISATLDRVRPQLSRISIQAGWKRVFGARGQLEALKAALKLFVIGAIVTTLVAASRGTLVDMMYSDPANLVNQIVSLALKLLGALVLMTLVLAAVDIVWSRSNWLSELRMTKQEVKDEHKEAEGNPLVKGRLRSLVLSRARQRMMASIPKATMVIANPTHFAIALRYVREENAAPLVIAKGQDLVALKIRELAEKAGIPVIEEKLLARSMYDAVEVNQLIPPAFYKAVAELIHYLRARGSIART